MISDNLIGMKILFNTYYHAFQNPGGGEIVLLKTMEALQRKGIQVELFNKWKTNLREYDLIHNFSTLNYRDWDGFKSFCPKLIVTPVMWPDVNINKIIKERITQITKTLIGLTSSEVNVQNALLNVDCFFPTTEMEKNRIIKRYGLEQSNFKVIYNGIDQPPNESSTNLFKEKYHLENYFLFVGRISPLKNVDKFISAAKIIDKTIVLIGGSDQQDLLFSINLKAREAPRLL